MHIEHIKIIPGVAAEKDVQHHGILLTETRGHNPHLRIARPESQCCGFEMSGDFPRRISLEIRLVEVFTITESVTADRRGKRFTVPVSIKQIIRRREFIIHLSTALYFRSASPPGIVFRPFNTARGINAV